MRRFLNILGPGLITSAADDDPSGISTYSVAGASFGYAPLWTAVVSFPMMVAVQLMCARLGMVTGRGLACAIRLHYPRWILVGACSLLVVANVINIAADLGGMAETSQLVTHISSFFWTPFYAGLVIALLFLTSYRLVARIFKWLTLALFAYVGTAFLAHADWRAVLEATVVPKFHWSREFLALLVAILGTTISPYLFFWQAAQEVEEERAKGRSREQRERRGATDRGLENSRTDVLAGMFFSNLIIYFIILTTAATLHAHGRTNIVTAREAAEALRPLAGDGAYWLFAVGLVGTGMLGIPVLAGSSAYAVAEAASWKGSLGRQPHAARGFYSVIGIALGLGWTLSWVHFNALKMLFLSAVINGLLAPPLILLVLLLTSSRSVMGERVNSPLLRWLGWVALTVMVAAALGMLFTS
jgi:NRAMP (natural resistance-associated macrophage protein)-like metal ion transporter